MSVSRKQMSFQSPPGFASVSHTWILPQLSTYSHAVEVVLKSTRACATVTMIIGSLFIGEHDAD
jgi:hypothetical protein